jgi:glycosyltransferase involved in cell wall biosynthesis
MIQKQPVTVLIAARNEEVNIARCLSSVSAAARVLVIDSQSSDRTAAISLEWGAEVHQFHYQGGYPKKRQWALDHIPIDTEWIFLLDADEVVPEDLWEEISKSIGRKDSPDAFLIAKKFHFLGKRFRFGGFSHAAVLLFRKGKARFENLFASRSGQDMEVHERLLVKGSIGKLKTGLIHQDFKGLEAYIARHNSYSTWEAEQRWNYLKTGTWGKESVKPRLFGNTQERRRRLKELMLHFPCEAPLWFGYHFLLRLGFLEGRAGLIASQLRARHFSQARAKLYELQLNGSPVPDSRSESRNGNPEVNSATLLKGV